MSPAVAAPTAAHDGAYPRTKADNHDGLSSLPSAQNGSIIDIRRAAVEINLKDDIYSMWNSDTAPRQLPTLLLYNEKGLQLFEDVCGCSSSDMCRPLTLQRSHTLTNTT